MRRYLYGLSEDDFEAMLSQQGSRCAICRTATPGGKGSWHVDHDHKSNAIRGLLCHSCNLLLGHAKDDSRLLTAAIEYLNTVIH